MISRKTLIVIKDEGKEEGKEEKMSKMLIFFEISRLRSKGRKVAGLISAEGL